MEGGEGVELFFQELDKTLGEKMGTQKKTPHGYHC